MHTYTASEVASKVGVPYRTLMNWLEHGLLNPARARSGHGVQTEWRAKDVREASVLNSLRRAGFSLQNIKKAHAYLRSIGHNPMSSGQFIVIRTGKGEPKDIVKICDEGEAMALLRDRGQLVLPLWDEDLDR